MSETQDRLARIGIPASPKFPTSDYAYIADCVERKFNFHQTMGYFNEAWNAVGHRFHGAVSISNQLKSSFAGSMSTRPHELVFESRHTEDQHLLYFFTSALSCIESAYFAVGAISNMISNDPSFETEEHVRDVTPSEVVRALSRKFHGTDIHKRLKRVARGKSRFAGYRKIARLRNRLNHRGAPNRSILAGDYRDGDTSLIIQKSGQIPVQNEHIVLNAAFLDEHVDHLTLVTNEILGALRSFVDCNIEN